ncbi:uncharacterized protein EI90DRAFT_337948 [Cantharellus anzutake]|uniref:uncharacterized protein n=1 Tax=Cantharellus anzutake TaxID=1750568 RepID=UPI00190724A5|nr:uncharacterized protein EI90DRAFT_337948 [Cantharellus anzutake]KAF8335494.1 hypothetical protein EI90DRAFT_337948 [Cantharellus anzutake]
MEWTPSPFNLLDGNPFQYSDHTISTISGTEAFKSGIQTRGADLCVICGFSQPRSLYYCHIIPRVECDTWQAMKDSGFVPAAAKSVMHEARNGIRLCATHRAYFDTHCFYIRWIPERRRFVFINHSQSEELEVYHGRAINLPEYDDRLPFHGAFLFHEMRVRGHWPLYEDRAIPLPISWVHWIDEGGNRGHSRRRRRGPDGRGHRGRARSRSHRSRARSRGRGRGRGGDGYNQDPSALEALKKSFAEQPNWRASVMEGTSWEGSANENAAKWRKLNRIDP